MASRQDVANGTRQHGRLHRSLLTLVLCVVSLSVALLSAEFAVRWIFRDISTTADNTSYFSQRWLERSPRTTNRLGYRERDFDPEPAEGMIRIAVVGDSIAYGQGIAEHDRFSNRLERLLNARTEGRKYEVLNFAEPGSDTVDHIEFLRRDVVPAHPGMVILQWFVNDAEGGDKTGRPRYAPLIPFRPIARWLHQSSAFYYLMREQWEQSQGLLGLGSDYSYNQYMTRRFAGASSEDGRRADHALRDFIRLARQNDLNIGMILFPQLSEDLGEEYGLNFLFDRVLAVCASEAVECVDMRATFAKVKPVSRLWANRFDGHPGPVAQQLAAERLLTAYSALWLTELSHGDP